jgi:hypothetical protein
MKNEVANLDPMENEISIIEQNHKNSILSIHENMEELVLRCNDIVVTAEDKETYEDAVELKRLVKSVHVGIEKKRKELKQPLIDYGKRLDKWVEQIYTPLVQAEKIVKSKMEVYEARQEELKKERKLVEEQEQKEQEQLDIKLQSLNSTLGKINSAKSKKELIEIENHLNTIILSDFGKKSHEAGFILNQLKLTCSMAMRLMKEEEEKPVEAPKMQTTPITDDFVNDLKKIPIEPIKKIVVGDITQQKNILNDGLFKQPENPVTEPTKESVTEPTKEPINESSNEPKKEPVSESEKEPVNQFLKNKASDEDVISMLDNVSQNVINDVISLIDERTKSFLSNAESFQFLDFSEHKELIYSEVKKRVGVLLTK